MCGGPRSMGSSMHPHIYRKKIKVLKFKMKSASMPCLATLVVLSTHVAVPRRYEAEILPLRMRLAEAESQVRRTVPEFAFFAPQCVLCRRAWPASESQICKMPLRKRATLHLRCHGKSPSFHPTHPRHSPHFSTSQRALRTPGPEKSAGDAGHGVRAREGLGHAID